MLLHTLPTLELLIRLEGVIRFFVVEVALTDMYLGLFDSLLANELHDKLVQVLDAGVSLMSAESCLTLETLDHTIANHSSLMHRRLICAFLSIRESHGGVLACGEARGTSTTPAPAVIPALTCWPLGCLECVLISIGAQELAIFIDCQVLLVLGDLIGARSTLHPVRVVSWPG